MEAVLVPMADHTKGAILQRDEQTWAVMVRAPGGLVTPGLLERVAAIARKYRVPTVKLTSGQRIDLIGIQKEDLAGVFEDLGPDAVRKTGPCIRFVQSCPGSGTAKTGRRTRWALP
jgi:NAD(P)H-nitrite reductase large subunit